MLIIFSGLPGSGKTTLAREVARRCGAVHLRIDTVEQALRRAESAEIDMGPRGYFVANALAEDNLKLGLTVIADSVNPLPITRSAWWQTAANAQVPFLDVEVICSDPAEHRRRVEQRSSDIPDLRLPDWNAVLQRDYHPWDTERLLIDTAALSVEQATTAIVEQIARSIAGRATQ